MPKKLLLESDFLTVDLGSIFNKQVDSTAENNKTNGAVQNNTAAQQQNLHKITDWNKELKKRLAANRSLSAEVREDDYNIEAQFFKDYFTTNWDSKCANELIRMGEPLKQVLKILGFDSAKNPILAFISDEFVKDDLIKTGLLNSSTFKAIYNAVAKKLVADSEFDFANDYNIIYCKDLYKKPAAEMIKYLELQSEVLEASGTDYSEDDIKQNKQVFIYDSSIEEKDPVKRAKITPKVAETVKTGILNSIELARQIYKGTDPVIELDSKTKAALTDKLKTPAQILAAIQFLSITTTSKAAKAALSNEKFGKVQAVELAKATAEVIDIMPKNKIQADNADTLVTDLLNKLR